MIAIGFYLGISNGLTDFKGAGVICDYIFSITVGLGFRTNVISIFFNMSYERVLYWHKVIGMLSIGIAIIHGFSGWSNMSGLGLFITMGLMAVSYLIKPYFFEIFYYIHILGIILLIIFSFLHYATVFPYVLLVWSLDIFLRYIVTMKKVTATATLLPGDVIRLQFTKSFNYEAGQYCFLLIKEISPIDFHPFSISTSPEQEIISFHIRSLGNWTNKLAGYITAKIEEKKKLTETGGATKENNVGENSIPLDVYIEGPYGSPMIDLINPTYEVLLLVSGGIGITPLQSLYNHLIHQSSSNTRKFRKVIFIWSVKDRAMVDALYTDKLHSVANQENQNVPYLPVSFQPAMKPPPVIKSFRGGKANQIAPSSVSTSQLPQDDPEAGNNANNNSQSAPIDLNSDFIFHNEYYLTKIRPNESQQHTAGIHQEVQTWLKFGRPDMKDIFKRTAELCKKENISRVGVCVCGPSPMINEVVDLCHWSLLDPRCGEVRFDCHSEVFDF